MDSKPWYTSKTVIYNGIKGLLGFITALVMFIATAQHQGILPFYIDEKWLAFGIPLLLMLDGYAGVQLRAVTDQPITRGKQ